MVLKDETDLLVPECGEFFFFQQKRITAVEGDGAGGRRLERPKNIEQRALAAAGRTHDGSGVARLER